MRRGKLETRLAVNLIHPRVELAGVSFNLKEK